MQGTAEGLRSGVPGDWDRLREIAAAAKGHWGYEPERVEAWVASDELADERLAAIEVVVAELQGRAVAWASLEGEGDTCILEDLWVEPDAMGRGLGTQLFRHACDRARARGASRLEWEAEPNALGFYGKLGGRRLRDSEPTTWGRSLPIMGVDL